MNVTRQSTAVLAGCLVVAGLALVAVGAEYAWRPQLLHAPEPTASTACRPFRADAKPVAHSGPLPPQAAWDLFATGNSNGARTLAEAAATSDVVLVGRWIGTEPLARIGDPGGSMLDHYVVAVIRIDRLVLGALPPGCFDLVRVAFELGSSSEADLAALERARPVEPALLFLRSWAGTWDRAGGELPEWVAPLDRYDIYRTIGIDGALPLVGDQVSAVVFENDMPRWRLALAGKALDEVMSQIEVASGVSTP